MTFKTSLLITGDAKAAKAEVDGLRKAVEQAGAATAKVAPQAQQLDKALDGVAQSSAGAKVAQGALDDQLRATTAATAALGGALGASTADLMGLSVQARGTQDDLAAMRAALGALAAEARELHGALEISRSATVASAQASMLLASQAEQASASMARGSVQTKSYAVAIGEVGTVAQSTGFQLSHLSEPSEALTRKQREATEAAKGLTGNLGLQRAGWQQLGYQVQDIGIQYSLNTRLSQIMAMQSGQLFSAIGLIAQGSENATGKLGKFATVMAGPWGIAAGVAISLGTLLWSELSKVDEASQDAANSSIDFSNSLTAQQAVVTGSIDGIRQLEEATRSLINTQALLIDNLRAVSSASLEQLNSQLAQLDKKIAERQRIARPLGGQGVAGYLGDLMSGQDSMAALEAQRRTLSEQIDLARQANARAQAAWEMRAANERGDPDARARGEIERERARLLQLREQTLRQGEIPFADGDSISAADFDRKMVELQRREMALKDKAKPKKDNSAAKAAREAERLAQFGERAEEAIARLNDQFNLAPRDIDNARKATAQLDGVIADLEKRRPPNYESLIEQARAIKPLIQDSLQRPIRDMLDDQERQIALGALQVRGREAEADALKLSWSLMDKLGAESEEQLAIELAKRGVTGAQVQQLYDNLAVMREQTREMRAQQALQQAFLSAVGDMRENVRQTIEDLRSEGPKAIGDFAKRSMDVFDRLFADVITEKLFGDFFNDLEDQITGGDKVSKAGRKLADAVDKASADIAQAQASIVKLGSAAEVSAAKLSGAPVPAAAASALGALPGLPSDGGIADIIVTGPESKGFKAGFESVFNDLKKGLNDVFTDIFGDKGLFGETLSTTLGKTFGNAALGGSAGSLVTGMFGIKGSGAGGMLGGALGGALGKEFLGGLGKFAGPLGSIVGGVLGSVLGGALKSTPKASATITGGGEDDVSVTGNKDSLKKASVGLARSVQDTLDQIAEEFGGSVGKFAVSIGIRHGDYRVDTSGSGKTKKKSGAVDFDEDQAGAIAYAVMDAITDGGITGISAAVQKALKSSNDLDDALEEALKVREVETALGGIGAALESQFKTFEAQAKERLRIASEYGFDVLAIEKKNAEDRAGLIEDMLEQQVGSLQRLIDEMNFGSMFEGSAIEQRDAILAEIEKAKADLAAGKDGAADALATLLQQLNTVSEEAFGTTGQYANDRTMILDLARNEIARANAQITAAANAASSASAAATSDPALAATNQALDENNDQNAELIALMRELVARNGGSVPPSGGFIDIRGLARTS